MKRKKAEKDDDVYHFISYLPVRGHLYELDGLKAGPIDLGVCTNDNWLEKVRPAIQKRISEYSKNEIRFNLMAIIRKKNDLYKEQLDQCNEKLRKIEEKIDQIQNGNFVQNDLPSDINELQSLNTILKEENKKLVSKMQAEDEKFRHWKIENIRRKHNYIPFVVNLLKILAEKGELVPLVEKARQKQRERSSRSVNQ